MLYEPIKSELNNILIISHWLIEIILLLSVEKMTETDVIVLGIGVTIGIRYHFNKLITMKKITLEITDQGWTTTVQVDNKTFIEKYVSTHNGVSAKSIEGNMEIEEGLPEGIYDVLDNFFPLNCMQSLQELK